MKLKDKVVVITGAGNGIGEGFAHRFSAEGAHIVLVDKDADAVRAVAKATGGLGVGADMTIEDEVVNVVRIAESEHGPVDIWFSNAGISTPRLPGVIPANDEWEGMWHLHVMAHLYAARALLPQMVERGDGYLLQTLSKVAIGTHVSKAAYAVTKHAGLALGEWLAIHYRPRGVKVSCFCPGAMRTPMLLRNDFESDDPKLVNALSPEQTADIVVKGIDSERFLILTNEKDVQPFADRANDFDAWLNSGLV